MALTNQIIGNGGITGGTHTIQTQDSAQRVRLYDLAFLTEGALGTSEFTTSRPGILAGPPDSPGFPPASMAFAVNGGLNIGIRPGAAVVERSTLVGSYVVAAYSSGQVTLATADPTNPRIDRVDLQVLDGALGDNGGTSKTWYVVTTGVASGSPAVPAAPANSIPLYQILLPANTTTLTAGMFTDKRRSAGLRGANRYMFPGDSLSDPGYLAGETRMRLLSGYAGTPVVTDYWGSDGAWHGQGHELPILGTWQNGTNDINAGTTETLLYLITIPDPGYAYYLKANINVEFTGLAVGNSVVAAVHQNNLSGAVWCSAVGAPGNNGFESVNGSYYLNSIPGSSQPVIWKWTGSNTFALGLTVLGAGTATCKNPANFGSTQFNMEVIPVP